MTIKIRPLEETDLPFVVSGWSASFRTSHSAGLILMEDWPGIMHGQIGKVLTLPHVRTLVATESTTKDLLGFLTFEAPTLPGELPFVFYCYVKQAYRRGQGRLWEGPGLARRLFAAAQIDPAKPFEFACKTSAVSHVQDRIPYARHKPLRARFPRVANDNQAPQEAEPWTSPTTATTRRIVKISK